MGKKGHPFFGRLTLKESTPFPQKCRKRKQPPGNWVSCWLDPFGLPRLSMTLKTWGHCPKSQGVMTPFSRGQKETPDMFPSVGLSIASSLEGPKILETPWPPAPILGHEDSLGFSGKAHGKKRSQLAIQLGLSEQTHLDGGRPGVFEEGADLPHCRCPERRKPKRLRTCTSRAFLFSPGGCCF